MTDRERLIQAVQERDRMEITRLIRAGTRVGASREDEEAPLTVAVTTGDGEVGTGGGLRASPRLRIRRGNAGQLVHHGTGGGVHALVTRKQR